MPFFRRPRSVLHSLVLALAGAAGVAGAQQQDATEVPAWPVVAEALADPATRHDALLAGVVLERLAAGLGQDGVVVTERATRAAEDLAWVRRLDALRHPHAPRSTVSDPAPWVIQLELNEQRDLPASAAQFNPVSRDLLREAVFERGEARRAATLLTVVLNGTATALADRWGALREAAAREPVLATAIAGLLGPVLQASAPPADTPRSPDDAWLGAQLDALLVTLIEAAPPDPSEVTALRRSVLLAWPEATPSSRQTLAQWLDLAERLDGLHDGQFLAFADGLLAIVANRVDAGIAGDAVGGWLVRNLPTLSAAYARRFAAVDPRLNGVLAAALDALRGLPSPGNEDVDYASLQQELADAVTQLSLVAPSVDAYFDQPVRRLLASELDVCISIIAQAGEDGEPRYAREQFDGCVESMVRMADGPARASELSGDANGPFGHDQLHRELALAAPQRVNYALGYLHQRYATGCQRPSQPLPNPLEWAVLANFLAWLAEQSPVYFTTPENQQRLARMRAIGSEISATLMEQADCFAGAGSGVSDPVSRVLADYREAHNQLLSGVRDARHAFRAERLAPGADISLAGDGSQSTSWRPDDLQIGPCSARRACEMTGNLAPTRALIGLFPEPYLVAHQSGLGQIEICYDRMSWQERRSEPVRPDDDNVANYFGRLSFELHGRYREGEEVTPLFASRFLSPREHHYLFAAADQEVLEDECPTEIIGTRIVTPLPPRSPGIVPNRLTYLAAPRTLPSELLAANWERGAEWRDWFVTGIGVTPVDVEPPPAIRPRLDAHLQALMQEQQDAVYARMLVRGGDALAGDLQQRLDDMGDAKAMLRLQLGVFYPVQIAMDDPLRQGVTGEAGLLDLATVRRYRESNLGVSALIQAGNERLARFTDAWQQQSELLRRTGSVALTVAAAQARLDELHQRIFLAPAAAPVSATGMR